MARRRRDEEEQEPVDYELVKLNGVNVRIPTIKLTPGHIASLKRIKEHSNPHKSVGVCHNTLDHLKTFGLVEYLELIPSVQDMREGKAKVIESIKCLEKIVRRPFSDEYRMAIVQWNHKVDDAISSIPMKSFILQLTAKGEAVLAAFEKANKSDYTVESNPQQ